MPRPKEVWEAIQRARVRKREQLDAVAERVRAQFDRLRTQVFESLYGLDQKSLTRLVGRLIKDLEAHAQEFKVRATREIVSHSFEAVKVGVDLVDFPLQAAGLQMYAPDVTLPLLQSLGDFTADRITNLSADAIGQISLELRLGGMGAKDPIEVINAIADKLRTAGAGHAGFGSLVTRGEAITRTELGRIHSMASQRRLEQAAEQFPDLQKEWLHSPNYRNPRDGHVALHGTRVGAKEQFMVSATIGGVKEPMLHPRDPKASARNVVFCRCDVVPWMARWEE